MVQVLVVYAALISGNLHKVSGLTRFKCTQLNFLYVGLGRHLPDTDVADSTLGLLLAGPPVLAVVAVAETGAAAEYFGFLNG